jgi:hypothetical protein
MLSFLWSDFRPLCNAAPAFRRVFPPPRYRVNDRLRKGRKKVLLDDISGIVRPGQVEEDVREWKLCAR